MAMRFGSAMPSLISQLTPSVMSSCMARPHCLNRGLPEFAAIAHRATEVHLQHSVTTIGEELDFTVVAPAVAIPRAAVRLTITGRFLAGTPFGSVR